MTIAVLRMNPLPNGGEISEGRDDIHLDIDRWENDGGRSISTRNSNNCDCLG